MALQESGEMYLETIYRLTQNGNKARSIDVVEDMNYSKPSVSRAVGLLKNGGYLTVGKDGNLVLTPLGIEIAKKIYERHQLISSFLTSLGVSEETAAADACKIEHVISEESFEALKRRYSK